MLRVLWLLSSLAMRDDNDNKHTTIICIGDFLHKIDLIASITIWITIFYYAKNNYLTCLLNKTFIIVAEYNFVL